MDNKPDFPKLADRYLQISQKESEAECRLVADYRTAFAYSARKYEHAKQVKLRPLTIPAIFGRSHHENFISDYLAFVLDPKKNGIGTAPLEALLSLYAVEYDESKLDDVLIRREFPLESGRIDLLIECPEQFVIGIENKIYSPEGENQTPSYARIISDVFPDTSRLLVFLTRQGDKPKSAQFVPLSYANLFNTFKAVKISEDIALRNQVLWADFLEHVEIYIMATVPEKFEFSEKAKLYLENQKMLHDITTSFDREWESALLHIESRFREQATGGPWNTVFQTRYSWQQAYKSNWRSNNFFIHFEWWLPPTALIDGELSLSFMVDVEGKRASELLGLFANRHLQLETIYRQNSIAYCPPKRSNAIAFKKYSISTDIDQVAAVLFESFSEFRFLESEIDEVVASLPKP